MSNRNIGTIQNDTIQNSSVCGGGYQKVISEYDDGYELFSSLINDLRASVLILLYTYSKNFFHFFHPFIFKYKKDDNLLFRNYRLNLSILSCVTVQNHYVLHCICFVH